MVVYLERVADDLHMVQLMPLPPHFSEAGKEAIKRVFVFCFIAS